MHEENQKKFSIVCYFACVTYFSETETELDMDWIHPWIGLGHCFSEDGSSFV